MNDTMATTSVRPGPRSPRAASVAAAEVRPMANRRQGGPPNREELLRSGTSDHYEDAELYDFEYRDHRHDVSWYRGIARKLGASVKVLELGAGTGRITIPLAVDGHDVTALDRMPTMLARLQDKLADQPLAAAKIEPVLGDICGMPLATDTFDLVIAPFNVLMHLYRWQDLLACFREARRVLKPGGTFALDVLLPDLQWLTWDPDERHSVTYFTHPRTGAPIKIKAAKVPKFRAGKALRDALN